MIVLDNNYDYKIKYLVKINSFSSAAILLKIAISYSIAKKFTIKKEKYNTLGFKINEITLLGEDYLLYKNIIENLNNNYYTDKEFTKKILPEYIYNGLNYFFKKDREEKINIRKIINDKLLR